MIIYGINPVRESLRSHPERIRFIAVARDQSARHQHLIAEAKRAGVSVRSVPATQIEQLARGAVHNGVAAELSGASFVEVDAAIESGATFVLILDGITDPQNFGAILRVADGFGVDLVIISQHGSAGLTPAAVKASAGASEWVRMAQVTNLSRAIETLQRAAFWVYGAGSGGDRPDAIDFRGKVAIVLGSEGKGIRRNVLEHCDRAVTISMSGHVESLNVATAAAALCYEVARQNGR